MKVQQLRYLVAVADAASLSAAARSLDISQPVLSRAIRTLERELGIALVELDGRTLRVAPEAVPVVDAAREAIDAFERVAQVADRQRGSSLTVVASPSHQAMVTRVLTRLVDDDDVAVRLLASASSGEAVAAVRAGRADLAFGPDLAPAEDLDVRVIARLELVLASPIGTDLPDPVDLAALSPLRIVVLDDPGRLRLLEDVVAAHGGSIRPLLAVSDRIVLMKAVEDGAGSTIMTRALTVGNTRLEVRSFDPPLGYSVEAAIPRRGASSLAVTLIETLAAVDWR